MKPLSKIVVTPSGTRRVLRPVEARTEHDAFGRCSETEYLPVRRWRDATHYLVYSYLSGALICAVWLPVREGEEKGFVLLRRHSDGKIASGGAPFATLEAALDAI